MEEVVMLSINFIKKNPDLVKKACKAKNVDEKIVDVLLKVDKQRRKLIEKTENLRAEKNKLAEEIKRTGKPLPAKIKEGKKLKKQLKSQEPQLKEINKEYKELMYKVPNLPKDDVPAGKNEKENVKLRKWGKIRDFDFEIKDHSTLCESLDLLDVKRASKVSGSRFAYLKNELVLLEFALLRYGLKKLLKQDFVPVIPPILIKDKMMKGMGYLEHGEDQETYFLDKDNLFLVGTSEQSIGPMHSGEILDKKKLPLKYVAFSPCFRRESGSYGQDTKGIFRVHQFDKLEMFVFCHPKKSDKMHEYLLALEEELVQELNLPYRVVKMCTGDLGHPAARKYDIECWFPGQGKYRETHSASTCTAFQARRLKIKYRKKDGTKKLVHTLNGTYFAQRLLLAILENYQQKDGSVRIPKALRKLVGKDHIRSNFKYQAPNNK